VRKSARSPTQRNVEDIAVGAYPAVAGADEKAKGPRAYARGPFAPPRATGTFRTRSWR
jgi:hypothetical protein